MNKKKKGRIEKNEESSEKRMMIAGLLNTEVKNQAKWIFLKNNLWQI